MGEQWDAVVIGAGLGGLTTAACLAAAGRRVLVVERHDLAGGNATVFRRHHQGAEYEFDVGVHYIGECQPGGLFPVILGALGVGDRIAFRPLDPDGFDTVVLPGVELHVPAGWDAYTERLVDAVPGDRAAVERCMQILRDVAKETRDRYVPGVSTPTLDAWEGRTVAELFDECELSPTARALIDHWNGLYAGPPSRATVTMHAGIINHYMQGAFYPEGGGQVIPARLVQVIEALGGEVRTLAPVQRVMVADRRVTGVELADGTVVETGLVVSNADHRRTVMHLVGPEHWDPASVRFAEQATMTLGLAVVYVVVEAAGSRPGPESCCMSIGYASRCVTRDLPLPMLQPWSPSRRAWMKSIFVSLIEVTLTSIDRSRPLNSGSDAEIVTSGRAMEGCLDRSRAGRKKARERWFSFADRGHHAARTSRPARRT